MLLTQLSMFRIDLAVTVRERYETKDRIVQKELQKTWLNQPSTHYSTTRYTPAGRYGIYQPSVSIIVL